MRLKIRGMSSLNLVRTIRTNLKSCLKSSARPFLVPFSNVRKVCFELLSLLEETAILRDGNGGTEIRLLGSATNLVVLSCLSSDHFWGAKLDDRSETRWIYHNFRYQVQGHRSSSPLSPGFCPASFPRRRFKNHRSIPER